MNFKCSYTKLVELNKLVKNPKNPNQHPQNQIEMLAKIIDFQGQRSPIIVSNRSGFITKGHGRLLALHRLGWTKAAVDFQDYDSEAQEYADMVADNKIAELAEHNDAKMFEDIKSIPDLNLEMLGIPDFEIKPEEIELPELEAQDPMIQQITFIVSTEQKDIIDEAIAKAKKTEYCDDEINKNSNGNALAAIMRNYVNC